MLSLGTMGSMDNFENFHSRTFNSQGILSTNANPTSFHGGLLSPSLRDWPGVGQNDDCASTQFLSPNSPFNGSWYFQNGSLQSPAHMGEKFGPSYDILVAGNEGYQSSVPKTSCNSKRDGHNEPQPGNLSYVPLSTVEDDLQYNLTDQDDVGSATRSPSIARPQMPAIELTLGTESPSYQNWEAGNYSESRDGTGRGKSPRKEHHRSSITTKSTTSGHHKLRRTRNTQQVPQSTSKKFSSSQASNGPRTSHNIVEKQYRNRLNNSFDTLLAAIPSEMVGEEVNGYCTQGKPERRVSKAEVLVLAKKHIETLEREKESLCWEREELKGKFERLRTAWISSGGKTLP